MQNATVKYQVATYAGTVQVQCDENDENNVIIAKAEKELIRRAGPLPYGYKRFEIVEREELQSP